MKTAAMRTIGFEFRNFTDHELAHVLEMDMSGNELEKKFEIAMMALLKSSLVIPVARHRARVTAMVRPRVVAQDR
jgi:hypothetical protein